ncbi:MAG: phytanoyl-CoA dioxygenase family protein, partial [Sphingomonas sp.]|nr:phytanoyl-CoA dioxygenase family protein [Sphingomonas sp.]
MSDTIDVSGEIARHTADLMAQGYCILPNALPPATIGALGDDLAGDFDRTPFGQGGFYGTTTKRFGRLL